VAPREPAERILAAGRRLCRDVAALRFGPPVAHVYCPLDYARRPYALYVRRYGNARKRVLFLGMNPGPWGMAQTGVPFGEVAAVRDWLGVEAPVGQPRDEHPRRPVQGFACPRSEVSGARLWGAIAARYGTPERFFRHAFVANYCPLLFVEAGGRNRTPDHLPPRERAPLLAACDRHLRALVAALGPRFVVGIGRFAEQRARDALGPGAGEQGRWYAKYGSGIAVSGILHPSPASPLANRGWAEGAARALCAAGVCPAREDATRPAARTSRAAGP
jgi:single-strand selective monofunctional uracil DNA glycosylase